MIVLLVRHGETIWNTQHRLQSDTDAPGVQLTDVGRAQSTACGKLIRNRWGIDNVTVYSSPLKRCLESVKCMAIGTRVVKDDDLKERCLGPLAGMIVDRDVIIRLQKGTDPGIETMPQLIQRSRQALDAICRAAEDEGSTTVVVVTHGGFISSVGRWAGPNTKWPRVRNGHLCVLKRESAKWRVSEWNIGDTSVPAGGGSATAFGGGDFG